MRNLLVFALAVWLITETLGHDAAVGFVIVAVGLWICLIATRAVTRPPSVRRYDPRNDWGAWKWSR